MIESEPKYITFDCYGTLTYFPMHQLAYDIYEGQLPPEKMRLFVKDTFTGPSGATPDAVAERVLEAIRDDEFWIITSPWERGIVQARFDDALAHFPL